MTKVRVYEVARELGMENRDVVALFQSLGFSEVRNHMSSVETDAVERIKRKIERRHEPAAVEQQIAPTVFKRARRPEPRASSPGAAPSRAVPSSPGRTSSPTAAMPSGAGLLEHEAPEPRASAVGAASARASQPGSDGEGAVAPSRRRRAAPEPTREEVAEVAPREHEPAAEPEAAPAVSPLEAAPPAEPTAALEAPRPSRPAAEPPKPPSGPPPEPLHAEQPTERRTPTPPPERRTPTPPTRDTQPPVRPSSPPKTGIEVWEGRPGVPMPQRPRGAPPSARRTTYDPRAAQPGQRPGYGYGNRAMPGRPMRPGFGRGPGGRGFQRPGMPRKPAEVSTKEMSAHKMVIKIEGETSLQSLAAKMSLKATDVLMRLLSMGMTGVHINTTLDADTAKLLAAEFGWTVEDVAVDEQAELQAATQMEATEAGEVELRAPIVTVMGHVDHGKTTLLDTIRKTSVAAGEAGGITQHIGAYRVETKQGTICFLDTPGHEAFTAMRARGAGVTDLVILVVAADDGVMPQTREAISHARSAGVPIIVAVNKIDKPGVDLDRILRELSTEGLASEAWGGETMFCNVSAKTGEGVDHLLESVLLQAEMLELSASPQKRAQGVVIESLLDRGRGPVARVLIQDGTLERGDVLLAGTAFGKIRAMVDEKGRMLATAGPSTPVEVLGLNEVPQAGEPAHAVKDLKAAEALAAERKKRVSKSLIPQDSRVSLEALTTKLAEGEQHELKVILKADVQGSVEALVQALTKLSTPKVKLGVVHTGVGGITETDVNLAVAAAAIIIGFNVRPAGKAKKLAEQENVEIRLYDIIYEAIDDVKLAMEGLLPATKIEKELGKVEVRKVFHISKVGTVAGCMVIEGLIKRTAQVRLVRDSVVVWSGKLSTLKRFKDDAREVREGLECGLTLDGYNDLKEGDIVDAFEIEEIKASL